MLQGQTHRNPSPRSCGFPGCGGPKGKYGVCDTHRPLHPMAIFAGLAQLVKGRKRVTTCGGCNGGRYVDGQVCATCSGYGSVLTRR